MHSMRNLTRVAFLSAMVLATASVRPADANGSGTSEDDGWVELFDGQGMDHWRDYGTGGAPRGWVIDDGALHFPGEGGDSSGLDIITAESYTDFELELEWKVAPGGNSGIFYLANPGDDAIYWAAPEMQVLDDAVHRDGQDPLTSAGSAYALYPAPRGVVHPAGEWNAVRIVMDGGRVEQWMNGEKIVEYVLGSEEWKAAVARSKFADWDRYGRADSGHIGLQDHGDRVWFRNIRIRVPE